MKNAPPDHCLATLYLEAGDRLVNLPLAHDSVSPHQSDALPKLKGLAEYAEKYASVYRRIEMYAEIDGKRRVIDVTEPKVRAAVRDTNTIEDVYKSDAAHDYK